MNGWKLVKMIPPCFFIFEKCTPAEVAYRLDYKNNSEIKWNFTKFLVDRSGKVVERFEPTHDMELVEEKIKELL